MSSLDDRLERHARVAPPADLEHRVREAMSSALREQRMTDEETEAALPTTAPVRLPWAERCVYGLGLIAYGTQALSSIARVVWRAMAG
jgi:hypothetical protein